MLPALLLLAACAQGPTLDQRLSTFVGLGEVELVSALGVPVRVHEAEGRRFLQFEQRRAVAVAPPPTFPGPVFPGPIFPGPIFPGPIFPGPIFPGPTFYGPTFHGPVYGPWGPRAGFWPAPPSIAELRCELTFTLREARVETFSYRGQGCV